VLAMSQDQSKFGNIDNLYSLIGAITAPSVTSVFLRWIITVLGLQTALASTITNTS